MTSSALFSTTASAQTSIKTSSLSYVDKGWTRDLRIDFLRGFVFLLLFTVHFHYFSWFALIGWERIGVVSSAEVFILLAGIVTGAVYGKKLKSDGLAECTLKLLKRAWTLYKVAILVAGSTALLRLIPGLEVTVLTTFVDPITGRSYPLYPPLEAGFLSNLLHVLVLAAGPHQFQIIGLYAVLFLLTPVIFWTIDRGLVRWLLLVSWASYVLNFLTPESEPGTAAIRWTVGQFEFAFPTIAWQLLFVHGVVLGYYRHHVMKFFTTRLGKLLIALSAVVCCGLLLFSWNHPLDQIPAWAKLDWVAPESFLAIYNQYFKKYNLGPGRLLNLAVLLITCFALLTTFWKPINQVMGWLFVPLGQESMYVFFVHVYLILLVANTPLPRMQNVWINTALLFAVLLLSWILVRKRFLFRWIPH